MSIRTSKLVLSVLLILNCEIFGSVLITGSYDGYFSNDSFPQMSMKGKLAIENDSSGYLTIYNRRGHYDGPIRVNYRSELRLEFSVVDGDGDEIIIELNVYSDSLSGRWFYKDPADGYSGNALFIFEGPYIPSPEELYRIDDFIPADFQVPQVLETDHFRLRMLTVEDAEKDYDAVMSSAEYLREITGGLWPSDSLTLQDNIDDLARHQRDFLDREAFTYTVVNLEEDSVLGCVYINPPPRDDMGADAVVFMWVRYSEYLNGLDPELFQAVSQWLREGWPFEQVIYPGRE